jgi:iron complex outermembrane receptor protein
LTPAAYDPDIKWETTVNYNVGFDYGFFNDRLYGTFDMYLRDTRDLLNRVTTPMGSNYGNVVLTNIGSIRNKGVEFSVNGIPVQTNDWSVQVGFNCTFQDSRFTKLNSTDDPDYYVEVGSISKGTGSSIGRHMVGYEPYTYFAPQQIYDQDGNPIQNALLDRDGDGEISLKDYRMTGKSPLPNFFYGLNFKVSYKDWDFGFNGHGSLGYTVFNDFASANSTAYLDIDGAGLSNFAKTIKSTGFKAENDGKQYMSDMFIEDASFFRLDDINLGYTFREIGNWKGSIRVAASCQNVCVLTGFSGIDPEVNSTDGVARSFWPRPRTYSLRLNINF